MVSVFLDQDGVIMIDYLEKRHTITGAHYADQLRKLRQKIIEKRRGMMRRGVRIRQDNAPAHTSHVAVAAAHKCGFQLLPNPPYSLALAPSYYYVFPNLKMHVKETRYGSDDDVMEVVEQFLQGHDKAWYKGGLALLGRRWQKCIDVRGDCCEK